MSKPHSGQFDSLERAKKAGFDIDGTSPCGRSGEHITVPAGAVRCSLISL